MFGKKKRWPILTASFCAPMEDLRLAVEVRTGERVRVINLDPHTGSGTLLIGDRVTPIEFIINQPPLMEFMLEGDTGWTNVRFDEPYVAKVLYNHEPVRRGHCAHLMWQVGRSSTDRWEEPLFPEKVAYCAKVRGLSIKEYLATT